MSIDYANVHDGMDVYDFNGDKIGTVGHVWHDVGGVGYLEVDRGLFGIGEGNLYVPLGEIRDMEPGKWVSLNCGKDECIYRYMVKPQVLERR